MQYLKLTAAMLIVVAILVVAPFLAFAPLAKSDACSGAAGLGCAAGLIFFIYPIVIISLLVFAPKVFRKYFGISYGVLYVWLALWLVFGGVGMVSQDVLPWFLPAISIAVISVASLTYWLSQRLPRKLFIAVGLLLPPALLWIMWVVT